MDNLKYLKDMGDFRTYLVMHLADALEILNTRGALDGTVDNPEVIFSLPSIREAISKIVLSLQTIQELQFNVTEYHLDDVTDLEDNDD